MTALLSPVKGASAEGLEHQGALMRLAYRLVGPNGEHEFLEDGVHVRGMVFEEDRDRPTFGGARSDAPIFHVEGLPPLEDLDTASVGNGRESVFGSRH